PRDAQMLARQPASSPRLRRRHADGRRRRPSARRHLPLRWPPPSPPPSASAMGPVHPPPLRRRHLSPRCRHLSLRPLRWFLLHLSPLLISPRQVPSSRPRTPARRSPPRARTSLRRRRRRRRQSPHRSRRLLLRLSRAPVLPLRLPPLSTRRLPRRLPPQPRPPTKIP